MAGGIGGGISGGKFDVKTGTSPSPSTTPVPIPPTPTLVDIGVSKQTTIIVSPENANSISFSGVNNAKQLLTGITQSVTTTTQNTNVLQTQLASVGVNFAPIENPLNQYANYTYHIRWFMTDEQSAYNIPTDNPDGDTLKKTVIAESGVTAGFNITDFELKNTCSPGQGNLNTTNVGWTMTITEPFGISLIDKMRAAAITQPVFNYMRMPYFIDVWFTGYDANGNVIDTKIFYQLYRVCVMHMDVDLSEGGSRYNITGIMDGNLGNSNQISIPPSGVSIKAKTVSEFFTRFAEQLNIQQENANGQNFALLNYKFKIPPEIASWTLREKNNDVNDSRNDDLGVTFQDGTITITNTRGMSIENIVNYVISMCPEADKWVRGTKGATGNGGADISSNGIATWLMVHSSIKITGWDSNSKDYIRDVTYTLVRYNTVRAGVDLSTVKKLEITDVQKNKLNYMHDTRALTKAYQYIYTGENTEVIKFDMRIENFWDITLPLWQGVNTYSNSTQGPLAMPGSAVDSIIRGTALDKKQLVQDIGGKLTEINSTISAGGLTSVSQVDALLEQKAALTQTAVNIKASIESAVMFQPSTTSRDRQDTSAGGLAVSSIITSMPKVAQKVSQYSTLLGSEKALRYAEDVKAVGEQAIDPMPVVLRPDNEPSAQNADLGTGSNKAAVTGDPNSMPSGRSFIGSILGNIFNGQFFNEITLEIRGDPYWLGQGNIRENGIAASFGASNGDSKFANFITSEHMFVLVFRSGENYNEQTGLMQFDNNSEFFNGAYAVLDVTNTFKGGSFTQTLHAYKDVFAQKVSNEVTAKVAATTPAKAAPTTATNGSMPAVDVMGNATGF